MNAILLATVSYLLTSLHHCTHSSNDSRAIFSDHFDDPVTIAGIANRPALRVINAIFRPSPSHSIKFSAETRTRGNLVKPFSMPCSPMNMLHRSTVITDKSDSTTKTLIPLNPLRCKTPGP